MILLTGGTGLLGSEIIKQISDRIIAPTHSEMDIRSVTSIAVMLSKYQVDYIIHAAALTGIPRCESSPDDANKNNVWGTINMCKMARAYSKPIFYISTDYVFDGKKGNYKEEDVVNPLSVYAKTKLMGEIAVLMVKGSIFRTSFCKKVWPYVGAYDDKYSSFDTVEVIANLIIRCSEKLYKNPDHSNEYNILHIGTERKSFYDLASKISPNIQRIPLKQQSINPLIPIDSSLDVSKMKKLLGV